MRGGLRPNTRTEFARTLRRNETDAEKALWREIRNRNLNGFKFVRQYPIGPYIADFACREKALVVELAFDSAHLSPRHKSGIALRFPRINRIRWDKLAAEADTLETIRNLIGGQDNN